MDWLVRHLPRSKEELRREQQTDTVLQGIDAFMREVREDVRALQETAEPDRLDYPLASALRKRRSAADE